MPQRPVLLRFRYAAIAAMGLACLLVGFVVANVWNRKHPTVVQVQSAELHRTLDLSEYGTYRGDQPPSNPPLHLPAALLKVELVLPRLSQPGAYSIAVASDKSGLNRVACATGTAAGTDLRTVITVSLDLRSATPGKYVLSTNSRVKTPLIPIPYKSSSCASLCRSEALAECNQFCY
jgi:hypothetical protein